MPTFHVMHIRDSSGLYGAERVILGIARYLSRDQFRLTLLCLQDRAGSAQPLINKAKSLGIIVEVVPVNNAWDLGAAERIRAVLTLHSPDVIHTHDFKATLFGWFASRGLRMQRIVTLHGSVRDSLKIRLSLWLEEQIVRRWFRVIVVVAEDLRRQLLAKRFPSSMIRLIQNGVDMQLFKGTSGETVQAVGAEGECAQGKFIGVVGRLVPDKGHEYFIRAFARVAPVHPQVKAYFIGDGHYRSALEAEIRRYGLEGRILLCGARENVVELYQQMICVVLPSLREGLPYVLLEAMASHVPVLATAVGDIPKLVRNGETGYLMRPADIEDLEKALLQVLETPEAGARMARNAYQLVKESYSSERMVRETESVYAEALAPVR